MVASSLCLLASRANADCFEQAAVRYDVPAELLRAVAWVESGALDAAKAENRNPNGTRDIGRMQINTSHLPQLSGYGIDERSLRDECTSIHVGAWLLAHGIARYGLTWEAVGSYNVGCRALSSAECSRRRNLYAWRVAKALERQSAPRQPAAALSPGVSASQAPVAAGAAARPASLAQEAPFAEVRFDQR